MNRNKDKIKQLITKNEGEDRNSTIFLRFLAILLVVNSHMDHIYPIPAFSTGGAIGNSLFFMLSSYGLLLSEINKPKTFMQYYVKRIVRIYPTVYMTLLFIMLPMSIYHLIGDVEYQKVLIAQILNSPYSLIQFLFFPPQVFWFLQALMVFYIIGFFIIKQYTKKKLLKILFIVFIVYIFFYLKLDDYSNLVIEGNIAFKQIFYLMVFLSGIYFASINNKIVYSGKRDWLVLTSILLTIYGHKFLMSNGILEEFQSIQQILILPLMYYFLKISKSCFIQKNIMQSIYMYPLVVFISNMTLQIYVVHVLLEPLNIFNIVFPINFLLFLFITISVAYFIYRLDIKFKKFLD